MSKKNQPKTLPTKPGPEYAFMQDSPDYKRARANSRIAINHFTLIVGELELMKRKLEVEAWLEKNHQKTKRIERRHNFKAKYFHRPWAWVKNLFKKSPPQDTTSTESDNQMKVK